MNKNKKPLTDAQCEAKRERDRKYRAAKKAAKVAEVKKAVAKKTTEAKKIAKPIKTALPKPTAAVVEPRRVHIIKPGDAIHFDGFAADKLIAIATGIICKTAVQDHQRCLAEALKELTQGGGKHNKKEAKK